jgi:hypothetical protein
MLNCNFFIFKFQFCCTLHFRPTTFHSTCTNTQLYITTLNGYSLIRITFQWITNRDNTVMHTYLSLLLNVRNISGQVRGNAHPKQTHDGHCPPRQGTVCMVTISSHKPINKSCSVTHSWSWDLLEKLQIVQLLKNFPSCFGTRRSITVHTRALHWSLSWARSIQSIPSHSIGIAR